MGAVVVGIDGSGSDDPVLEVALREAHVLRRQLTVVLVYAAETGPEEDAEGDTTRRRRALRVAEAAVHTSVARHPSAAAVPVDIQVLRGDPADVLGDLAHEADLLVIGSAGPSREPGRSLGGNAELCAHRASGPLMVVPTALRPHQVTRIVMAVDPESEQPEVAAWARAEAAGHEVDLVCVTAGTASDPTSDDEVLLTPGSAGLGGSRAAADGTPLHLMGASVVATLLAFLRPGDLFVCGTRGRAGRFPAGLPSVSGAILVTAPCPVVLVPERLADPSPLKHRTPS